VGGITRTRGAHEMLRALVLVPGVRLLLCGKFEDAALEAEMRAAPGWPQVDYLGHVGREQVREVLAASFAGLVTLQPMPSYLDSLPIKMFEYMSAELPVIASGFPLWRGIVEAHGCGICVDPLDPAAIADAIRALRDSPERVRAMGAAGQRAVRQVFNWPQAERELLAFYAALLPA
jgi:glycosyltransferase involved in cell wall biosynthesis